MIKRVLSLLIKLLSHTNAPKNTENPPTQPDQTIQTNSWPADEDYADFVKRHWNSPQIELGRRLATINHEPHTLVGLIEIERRPAYITAISQNGVRKVFSAARNDWRVDGYEVDTSAFVAICKGVPAEIALAEDSRPRTPEEALAKDRHQTARRRFLMNFADRNGEVSWRVVSELRRSAGAISANCHYRYGERRPFAADRILALIALDSNQHINLEAYLSGRITLGKQARKNL